MDKHVCMQIQVNYDSESSNQKDCEKNGSIFKWNVFLVKYIILISYSFIIGFIMKSSRKRESIEYEDIETMTLPKMFAELMNHYEDKKHDKQRKEDLRQKISLAKEKDAEGIEVSRIFIK